MVEPTACAVHAALSAGVAAGDTVAVIGAGTLGLAMVAALHHLVRPDDRVHGDGRGQAPPPARAGRVAGRRHRGGPRPAGPGRAAPAGSLVLAGRLTDGADVVFDCVGTSESITQALAMVRPRGRVVLVGMPGRVSVDLAPLWHRELTLVHECLS